MVSLAEIQKHKDCVARLKKACLSLEDALVDERVRKGLGGKVPVVPPGLKRRVDAAEKEAATCKKENDALKLRWGWLQVNAGWWAGWVERKARTRPRKYRDGHNANGGG